jgi:hypothetical protein
LEIPEAFFVEKELPYLSPKIINPRMLFKKREFMTQEAI